MPDTLYAYGEWRGPPNGKGKGKGKKGVKHFTPFTPKGKSKSKGGKQRSYQTEASEETHVDTAAWSDQKGKGKKGKKGKGKGKKSEESTQTNSANVASAAESQKTSDNTGAASLDQWDSHGWSDAWVTFDVLPNDVQDLFEALVASQSLIDITKNPTFAILDQGCTKAMGSRFAIENFCRAASSRGLAYERCQSNAVFGFANSQKSKTTERLRIWFPTTPATSTTFEVLEEGTVPLLVSLGR